MKAKIVTATQFGNTEHGYSARLHYTNDVDIDAFWQTLATNGITTDCHDGEGDDGYDVDCEVFVDGCFQNKADAIYFMRSVVKEAVKTAKQYS